MRPKILLFSQSGVGGAERMTVSIGKAFDLDKYEVVFYLVHAPLGSSNLADFIPAEYNVCRISNNSHFDLMRNMYSALKHEKPDYVFCSAQHYNRKLLFLSVFFPKCKFIVRNANYLYTHTKVQKSLMSLSYPFADKIITQTEEMSEELIKGLHLKRDKIICLHNPVDAKLIDEKLRNKGQIDVPPCRNGVIRYIAVGRFDRAKGFDLLIQAFNELLKQQPNSELIIIGNNEGNCANYFLEVSELVNTFGIENKVFFAGYTDNPYVYEITADCFVLSSRNEGLPNVLIEALYLGIPAAAFKCIPIIERIIKVGETGFLAEKENFHSLAEAMRKAPMLGKIKSTYHSASLKDFTDLFV